MTNKNNSSLWLDLSTAYHDLYDVQYLGVEGARIMSERYDSRVLFVLKSDYSDYFNVWSYEPKRKRLFERFELSQKTLCGWMATTEVVCEEGTPERCERDSKFWRDEGETAVIVPLPYKTAINPLPENGYFVIYNTPNLIKKEPLEAIASMIYAYIERAHLKKETIQQDIEYTAISNITAQLSAKVKLDNIFTLGASEVKNIFYAEVVSIGLIDQQTNQIKFVSNLLPDGMDVSKPLTLSLDQGIAGWVATNKESIIVNDPYNDPRFFNEVDEQSGFVTRSILAAPMFLEGEVIGVVEILNKTGGIFTAHEQRLLEIIASVFATAIRSAELHEDIVAEKQRVEAVFDNMSEGLMSVTRSGEITAVNESLLIMLDKVDDTLKGEKITDLFPAKDHAIHTILDQLSNGSEYSQAMSILKRNGQNDDIPVLISAAANDSFSDEQEAIFTFSDITQVRELERMRDDLFHGIVHELRTPLATILLYARLIKSDSTIQDQEKFHRFLNLIEETSDDLQATVRRMIKLAEMDSADFKRTTAPVDLNKILNEVLPDRIMEAEQKGLTLKTDIGKNLPAMIGDYELIKLIFSNLVTNAIKFTDTGKISVSVKRKKDNIVAVVKDQGIGIPEEALPNMFKRFYRTRTAVEHGIAGTGIGLHMVKQAVDVHKGSIDLQSEENKGTQFTISLPLIPNL